MKFFPFFILLIGITNVQYDDSKILWREDFKLSWDDFWQIPPPKEDHSNVLAMSACLINYNYTEQKESPPKFEVRVYFVKDSSWTRTQSTEILKHEQLHFDMTELYARKIRKGIDSLYAEKVVEVSDYLKIFNKYFIELSNANNIYDKETLLLEGIINERLLVQQNWIDSISIELDKLKEYELKQ